MYDVCVIGAGVVGASIARELSKYRLKTILLEKAEDVSQGSSKANSGIVHGGYSAKHGTLKGDLSAEGNRRYTALNEELHFGFRRTGSLVLGFNEEDEQAIEALYANGKENNAEGLEIISGAEVREMEPNVSTDVRLALYCASAGVTSPCELVIALVENAIHNGVELRLNAEVTAIEPGDPFIVHSTAGEVEASFVVNAGGVFSDRIAEMVGARDFTILPRKGEYVLFERGYGKLVRTVVFQTPSAKGKGILVTSTFHGNLMIGPNAEDTASRDAVDTTEEALREIIETARRSVPSFDLRKVITNFSGLRATSDRKDFIIEESSVPRFINVAGIESPGLTSSPVIAERTVEIAKRAGLSLVPNRAFDPLRRAIIVPKSLPPEEVERRLKLDSSSPERLVCRCEQVSEREILDAMARGIPVTTTDAVKRRTRAGMGQCQGNFCRSRVKALLARELGKEPSEIRVRANELATANRPKRIFFFNLAKEGDNRDLAGAGAGGTGGGD